MMKMPFPHVIIPHVKVGYESRATHIERMLGSAGIPFEYMLDGDMPDITQDQIDEFFVAPMNKVTPQLSCSLKHLLVCRCIVERNLPGALVLEDDAIIFSRFRSVVARAVEELSIRGAGRPAIISFENTRLRFVPRSIREKDRIIYPGDRDRYAGCFYINLEGAKAVLEYARERHLDRPIDLFHRLMLDEGLLDYWWAHPTVATQGSFTGKFDSMSPYNRLLAIPLWRLKLAYRKLLYFFR